MFVHVFVEGDRSTTRLVQGKKGTDVYKSCELTNTKGKASLLNEAKILRLLGRRHVPVAALKAVFKFRKRRRHSNTMHLRLEAIQGSSLEEMLLAGVRCPQSGLCDLIEQMLDGLQFLADKQVLHRDIHPGNILFTNKGRVYFIDFEMARMVDDGEDLMVCGVPEYWPPEIHTRADIILNGEYEQKNVPVFTFGSDLFAAGIVAVELLTSCLEGKDKDLFQIFDEKADRRDILLGDAFYEHIQQKDFLSKMGCQQVTDAMATAFQMFFIKEQADRATASDIKAALISH